MASLCITNGLHSLQHRSIELVEVFCSDGSPYLVGDFYRPSINVVCSCFWRFFISDQRFSIGLRLGLIPGRPLKSFTLWLACHFFVDGALCAGAPSFIRVKSDSLHHFCPFLKTELFLLLTLISKWLDLE